MSMEVHGQGFTQQPAEIQQRTQQPAGEPSAATKPMPRALPPPPPGGFVSIPRGQNPNVTVAGARGTAGAVKAFAKAAGPQIAAGGAGTSRRLVPTQPKASAQAPSAQPKASGEAKAEVKPTFTPQEG